MKQDPENGKDAGRDSPPASSFILIFAAHRELLDRLYAESGAPSWDLPRDRFESALERGAEKHFASSTPAPQKLEEYLGALHLQDLALASACAEGLSNAWDHFVRQYRVYLRSAAAAILRCPSSSPAAIDLADSLFTDLYGLGSGKDGVHRSSLSLFRYFHGRSSLKTWLRAVLAQRHIDAIRANRRFTELDDDGAQRVSQVHPIAPRSQSLPDPHRARYVALLAAAFDVALASLDARDRERLRLYYAEQQTLAEIGRALGEHESSVSRNLDRIRRDLRNDVEESLRRGRAVVNGLSPRPGLSDEEIALCFEYASQDAPIDLDKLFPRPAQPPKSTRQQP